MFWPCGEGVIEIPLHARWQLRTPPEIYPECVFPSAAADIFSPNPQWMLAIHLLRGPHKLFPYAPLSHPIQRDCRVAETCIHCSDIRPGPDLGPNFQILAAGEQVRLVIGE